MTLPQAMRVGAIMRPHQEFRSFFGDALSSCALGAAAEGAGLKKWQDMSVDYVTPYEFLKERFADEMDTILRPTCKSSLAMNCGRERPITSVYSLVKHLNDDHRLTREEIADCLEAVLSGRVFTCSDGTVVEPANLKGATP